MKEKSTYGLKPKQLERLLSIGSEEKKSDTLQSQGSGQPQIEGYEILDKLGEAGQGQIWCALQLSTNRKVALKVPIAGLIRSDKALARFEREVELAASLKHPNIAQIHDSGIQNGIYYYAMDLIEGVQLDEYVKRRNLATQQIMELMRTICLAVQHAHQNGVIHRDLKPSNIVVTEDGRPYVLDFGLAKNLLKDDLSVSIDGEAAGTPAYMSPEQAVGNIDKLDTRTDVYSLGVILFTLLTGESPHDLSGSRIEVMRRIAQEQVRRPRKISPQIDKDLEFLLLKALDNEPDRRYITAGEMARDIENYLQGTPLIAGPPSNFYRAKKFVRRHRTLVTGIAAVLTVLVAGIIVSIIFAFGQARARAKAQDVSDFLQRIVLGSLNQRYVKGKEITARSALDAISQELEGKFQDQPLFEAQFRQSLASAYGVLGLYEPAESNAKRAFEICRTQLGTETIATPYSWYQLGWLYMLQCRYHEAEPLLIKALANFKLTLEEEHPDRLFCMAFLGLVYNYQGRFTKAEELFKEALSTARRCWDTEEGTLFFLYCLALSQHMQGRYDEVERHYLRGLEIARRERGERDQDTLLFMHGLGELRMNQGRYEEAEKLLCENLTHRREAWGKDHQDTLNTMAVIGWLYHSQGRYEEAEDLLSQTLSTTRRVLGNEHLFSLYPMHGLSTLYLSQGRYDEAEPLLKEALEISNKIMGKKNWYALHVMNTKAKLYTKQKRYDDAESLFKETLESRQRKLGQDHPDTLETKNDLAVLYMEQARYEEAEPLLLEAANGRIEKLQIQHPHTKESIDNLIKLYEAWNKPEKAEQWRAKLPQTEAKIE